MSVCNVGDPPFCDLFIGVGPHFKGGFIFRVKKKKKKKPAKSMDQPSPPMTFI